MLAELARLVDSGVGPRLDSLTASGAPEADCLSRASFDRVAVIHETAEPRGTADTGAAVARFLEGGADLVIFCGGDGIARDVVGVTGGEVPVIAVAAGVEMFSGVFGVSPRRAARAGIATALLGIDAVPGAHTGADRNCAALLARQARHPGRGSCPARSAGRAWCSAAANFG